MNPQLYKENGVRKSYKEMEELEEEERKEKFSNRYKKARDERREHYRVLREKRKLNNPIGAKHIFQLGNEFMTENNSFKAWGMKGCRMAQKTKEKYGSAPRKNDYTKQIHDRAVGSVDARVKLLAEQKGLSYNKVSGFDCSTYNHFTQKNDLFLDLSKRLIVFDASDVSPKFQTKTETFDKTIEQICDNNGNVYILQRDLYAASKMLYLYPRTKTEIVNGKEKKVTIWEFDQKGYEKFFDEVFYPKHKEYIKKLIEERNLNIDNKMSGTILGY